MACKVKRILRNEWNGIEGQGRQAKGGKNVGGFVWVALVMVDDMRCVIFGVRTVVSNLL